MRMGVAVLALMAITGLVIVLYGNARFDAGKSKCVADDATAAVTAANQAAADLERIENETNNLDDAGIDRELRGLGIMRQPQDY